MSLSLMCRGLNCPGFCGGSTEPGAVQTVMDVPATMGVGGLAWAT